MFGDHLRAPLGLLQRGRADVDAAAPRGQCRGQRLVVADAAGHLDVDVEFGDHSGEEFGVAPPPERRVEVDKVNPFGPLLLPGQRGRERVAVVRLRPGLTLDQANGLTIGDIDSGQ